MFLWFDLNCVSQIISHYRKSVGALIVYDITKEKSFENSIKFIESVRSLADPDIVIILVGNKTDLVVENPEMRKVSIEEANEFAEKNNLLFEETSAITGQNTIETFEKLFARNKKK